MICLGVLQLVGSLYRPLSQGAWVDLGLAVAIMLISIQYGYLTGVVAGIVMSCLLFAYSYGRIGVIRRKVTRASFSSNVQWDARSANILQAEGDAIHIYWLRLRLLRILGSGLRRDQARDGGAKGTSGPLHRPRLRRRERYRCVGDLELRQAVVLLRGAGRDTGVLRAAETTRMQLEKSGLLGDQKPHKVLPVAARRSRGAKASCWQPRVKSNVRPQAMPSDAGYPRKFVPRSPVETLMRYFREARLRGRSVALCAGEEAAETIVSSSPQAASISCTSPRRARRFSAA